MHWDGAEKMFPIVPFSFVPAIPGISDFSFFNSSIGIFASKEEDESTQEFIIKKINETQDIKSVSFYDFEEGTTKKK